eukprot:SAG11_NODE_36290_length_262_cov_0.938650_1_plen_31_part_10
MSVAVAQILQCIPLCLARSGRQPLYAVTSPF